MNSHYIIKLLCGTLLSLLGVIANITCSSPVSDHQLPHKDTRPQQDRDRINSLAAWQELIRTSADLSEAEQLRQVNDFFNLHIRYRNNIDLPQERDHWSTPQETLRDQAADGEDYAVAKYLTLLQLGVPEERLRLIYVKAQIGAHHSRIFKAHMVLGYHPTKHAVPLVLDNLNRNILSADQRKDLQPLFSVANSNLSLRQNLSPAGAATARLSPWRDLLTRSRAEGLRW